MSPTAFKCCIKGWVHLDIRPDNIIFGGLQPLQVQACRDDLGSWGGDTVGLVGTGGLLNSIKTLGEREHMFLIRPLPPGSYGHAIIKANCFHNHVSHFANYLLANQIVSQMIEMFKNTCLNLVHDF